METVTITGGTGLLGSHISAQLLASGYRVIVLTRDKKRPSRGLLSYSYWNPETREIDETAISGAEAIINLAGANLGSARWTRDRKKQIFESRVNGAALLCQALRDYPNQVSRVISVSATGYYGSAGIHSEEDRPGTDFLADTCVAWERRIAPVSELGKRLVILRLGIVLSPEGGALKAMSAPARRSIAIIPGTGRQWLSWIHIKDAANAFQLALEQTDMEGIFNTASPVPVSWETFAISLANQMKGHCRIRIKIPAWMLKGIAGEMAEGLLKSCRVHTGKLDSRGFQWSFPQIGPALAALMQDSGIKRLPN
jgi:uncharacterized protein (TIGR01777 family)